MQTLRQPRGEYGMSRILQELQVRQDVRTRAQGMTGDELADFLEQSVLPLTGSGSLEEEAIIESAARHRSGRSTDPKPKHEETCAHSEDHARI